MSGRDAAPSGEGLPLERLSLEGLSPGRLRRLLAPRATLRLAASLAARPVSVLRRGAGLVAGLGAVGLGTSTVAPHRADERFAEPGWLTDPLRRRAMQTYLVTAAALAALLDDASSGGGATSACTPRLEADDEARMREILTMVSDLICPARPALPPTPTGTRPHDGGGPVPGRDIAATPGAVVLRTPMCELLQYLPQTDEVHDVAVLVVPPLMHRYYLADLAPRHSLVEHLVRSRHQVFALSWPDPGPGERARGLDAHVAAVLDAVDACTRITRRPRIALLGVRTGGLLAAAVQSHLTAIGSDDRIAASVYLATVLDQSAALPGFRLDPGATRAATEIAARDGVLQGPVAARSWTWRHGGEQVRPYEVTPVCAPEQLSDQARDALRYWSGDLLRMPAALHADLVALAAADADQPGTIVLGTPVEPRRLTRDAYLVAAADDPVQRWTAGYRTAELLGGSCRMVLAGGDQAGALLVPPDRAAGASFRVGPEPVVADAFTGPDDWLARSQERPGSWWDDLTEWLGARSGTLREAPPELGGRRLHPLFPAPGTYLTR
ncbi:MAG: hypothetical protein L0I76_14525 [Pseudonocardia sp.]|nr:hypothetical protein [Pseudonocardia sp.]